MKEQEFYDYAKELTPYLEHIDYAVNSSSRLLGLLFSVYNNIDDEGNIKSFSIFNKDALSQLVSTAKRLSSYADKFQNKVDDVSKTLQKEFKEDK